MGTVTDKANELATNVKEYIANRIAMIKLEIAEKTSKLVAAVIAGSVVILFIFLFMMFAGMCAADLIADWTGRSYLGPLIVSGIYLLLAIIFWLTRDKLIRMPVMNAILQQLFTDEKDQ